MPVRWEAGDTAAHQSAHKAAHTTGEFDSENPEWSAYYHLREALINVLLIVQFPADSTWAITEKNWEEMFTRVYIYEHMNDCCRRFFVEDPDNPGKVHPTERREEWFTPEEIHSMIGLRVNAGGMSDTKFANKMIKILRHDAAGSIARFKRNLNKGEVTNEDTKEN